MYSRARVSLLAQKVNCEGRLYIIKLCQRMQELKTNEFLANITRMPSKQCIQTMFYITSIWLDSKVQINTSE